MHACDTKTACMGQSGCNEGGRGEGCAKREPSRTSCSHATSSDVENDEKLDNLPVLFEILKGGGSLALTNHTESSLLQDLHDMSQKHDWDPGSKVCDMCGS